MTLTRSQRLTLATLVFCTAALAGWWQADRPGNPDVAGPSAIPTRSSGPPRTPHHASSKAEPENVRRLLAPRRAARTPEERQRAAIHLALTLPVPEMAAWFDAEWYPFRDGIDATVFSRIARLRWQEQDPAGYLNRTLVQKSDDTSEAAGQWAQRDPAAALAWLGGLTDPRDFNAVAESVYRNLAKAGPALALAEILKVQRRLPNADSTLSEMLASLADNSAQALRQAAAAWPMELRQMADQALTHELLKRDFSAGLADLLGRDGGRGMLLKALNSDSKLAATLIDHVENLPEGWLASIIKQSGGWSLVKKEPERWLKLDLAAHGLDATTAAAFRGNTLCCLLSNDPAAALQALETVEMGATERLDFYEGIFRTMASRNPAEAQAMLAQLSDPVASTRCEQLLESLKKGEAKPKDPPTPTELMAQLGQPGSDSYRLDHRLEALWDRSDTQAARTAFAQLSSEQKTRAADFLSTGPGVFMKAPELRADAIRWLLENPPAEVDASPMGMHEDDQLRNASRVAADWARDDPQAASRWAQNLPPGDTRLWVMKNLARQWAEYEPSAASAWARTLPAAERAAVEAHLETETR